MKQILVALLLSCALVAGAYAEPREKDPFAYPVLTYLWVLVLAGFGGVVNFARKLKAGHVRAFNIVEFLGEIVTSGFAGLLTFWMCEAAEFNPLVAAVLIGISGHMGSRAIFHMEKWAESRFGGER